MLVKWNAVTDNSLLEEWITEKVADNMRNVCTQEDSSENIGFK